MKELFGDLWDLTPRADALCITTNGTITNSGRGVMGRGLAYQAKQRYPGLEYRLGKLLKEGGNHVHILRTVSPILISFPVKHLWEQKADPLLIVRSAQELVALADEKGWTNIVLPRPGCGNGGLTWNEVRPLLEPFLFDRFTVVEL